MGLQTILKKLRQKEKEMRLLMLYVLATTRPLLNVFFFGGGQWAGQCGQDDHLEENKR